MTNFEFFIGIYQLLLHLISENDIILCDLSQFLQRSENTGTMENLIPFITTFQKDKACIQYLLENAENVAIQISQVAAASEEQSATAEQVSTNIEGINNVANESAVGVQQIASASEDLNRLTENLSQLVEQFRVDKNQDQNFGLIE